MARKEFTYKMFINKTGRGWMSAVITRNGPFSFYVTELGRSYHPTWEEALERGYERIEQHIYDPMAFA